MNNQIKLPEVLIFEVRDDYGSAFLFRVCRSLDSVLSLLDGEILAASSDWTREGLQAIRAEIVASGSGEDEVVDGYGWVWSLGRHPVL